MFLEQGSQGWWPSRLSFPARGRVTLGDVQACSPVVPEASNENKQAGVGSAEYSGRLHVGRQDLFLPAGPLWLLDTCRTHSGHDHQHGRGEGLKAVPAALISIWNSGAQAAVYPALAHSAPSPGAP